MSLPSWERGLKFGDEQEKFNQANVAPFVGAWIEIGDNCEQNHHESSRSLRGSVD